MTYINSIVTEPQIYQKYLLICKVFVNNVNIKKATYQYIDTNYGQKQTNNIVYLCFEVSTSL